MQSASVVKIQSNCVAAPAKSSKWTGSSLFQNTVGMADLMRRATMSRNGERGAWRSGRGRSGRRRRFPPTPTRRRSAPVRWRPTGRRPAPWSADVAPIPGANARCENSSRIVAATTDRAAGAVAGEEGCDPVLGEELLAQTPQVERADGRGGVESGRRRSPAHRRGTGRCCGALRHAARGRRSAPPVPRRRAAGLPSAASVIGRTLQPQVWVGSPPRRSVACPGG